MVLLILEIGLTISAWQRGWKGWALLPGAFALAGGYMLGMVLGGDSSVDFFSVGIIIDILCVIALIIMVSKPRGVHASSQTPVKHEQSIDIRPSITSEMSEIHIK